MTLQDKYKTQIDQLLELAKNQECLHVDDIRKAFAKDNTPGAEINEIIGHLKEKGIKIESKSQLQEWIESIIIAFILAMFIRAFFIQAFKIPSGSMRPTLIEGDRLMVNKLRYGPLVPFTKKRMPGLNRPQRGDIIVFIFPEDNKRDFIKRLIAFGGETVEIVEGGIYIDGKIVTDSRIKKVFYYNRGEFGAREEKIKVPEGNVFVLGDNSASSHDSRYWGFVPEENIVGRAEFIYWPLDRIRFLNQ